MSTPDELLKRSIEGDRQALSELLELFGPAVRRALDGTIPRKWQSVLSMDDLMQQAYTAAFLHIRTFTPRGEGSFTAWLTTLARNMLYDALRMLEAEKRGGKRQRIDMPAGDESYMALYEIVGATSSTPSRNVARGEARSALEQAITELPEDYRRLVQMYDIEGHTAVEVAAAMGRSVGAVYMLRARAHCKLAELMGHASNFMSRSQ